MSIDETEDLTIVSSSVRAALKAMSGKWKPSIILHLLEHDLRYGRLRQAMPTVSEKVLIQQIKELRKDGIVTRTAYSEIPPRVEYGLTAYGRTTKPLLKLLSAWGTTHLVHQAQTEPEV